MGLREDKKSSRYFPWLLLLIPIGLTVFLPPGNAMALRGKPLLEPKIIHERGKFFEYDLLTFEGISKKKYPLMVVLHGSEENPKNVFERWREEAINRQVMIVVPNWMEVSQYRSEQTEEIFEMIQDLAVRYPVDTNEIFVSGISAGGGLAQHLMEVSPEKWRGVILMAYVPPLDWFRKSANKKPPPLFFAYGSKDPIQRQAALTQGTNILKSKRFPVQLLLDPAAGHEHRLEWNKTIFDWMEKLPES